jgi:predicted transcriptional regulator
MNAQNPNRNLVKQLVSLSPGIHLRRLQKLLGLSFSTTRYHVNNLVRDGEVVCFAEGGYSRLYPAGTTQEMKEAFACLQSKTARVVLSAIVDDPSHELTQGRISELADLPRSTTSESVALLIRAHLVGRSIALDGRMVFRALDADKASTLLAVFTRRGVLTAASERFIDLWDI